MIKIKPHEKIRIFDLFVCYKYLQKYLKGDIYDIARRDAIWEAKIIAKKNFNPQKDRIPYIDGNVITEDNYHSEIIDRMGSIYYYNVFEPMIKRAIQSGMRFEQIKIALLNTMNTKI